MTNIKRPRLRRAAAAGILISALIAVGPTPSSAVHDEGLFELDANVHDQDAPGDDWSNIFATPTARLLTPGSSLVMPRST